MLVHAESGATAPVISTNGHAVNFIEQGTTFVVANQSDIQGNWLDVTVPKAINLDLQGQNTSIQVKGVDGQMVITVNNGTIIITNSTLEGTSKFSGTNSFLSFTGQLDPQSNSTFTGAWVGIQVTLPGDAKLHLKADAHQSGTLTGNFNGLPNNAPSFFDGFLNSNAGDSVATLTFDAQHTSMSLNHQ